jgi:hypothetical protein
MDNKDLLEAINQVMPYGKAIKVILAVFTPQSGPFWRTDSGKLEAAILETSSEAHVAKCELNRVEYFFHQACDPG